MESTNVTEQTRSERFAADVRAGRPLRDALDDGMLVLHHDAVVPAALTMLARDGGIDMKRLAADAGMSRASLYRYYPDRQELIGEIASLGVDEMASLVAELPTVAARVRAVGEYLLTHPAQTIAMREMAELVSTDALDTVAEMLLGSAAHSPWLIGIAAMCGSRRMSAGDMARVRNHIEELAALTELAELADA